MNLRHLEVFHHFCHFGSMSRAAAHLGISQPAVSQQLHSLEDDCGVKLFYREGSLYRLTETGEAIFLLTRRIFCRVNQVESLVEQARTGHAERLRIGTTKGYARTVMPDLLAQFQRKFPGIMVRLSEDNSAELLVRLRRRKEDLVIVASRSYDAGMRRIPFAKAEFILVARPDHPLAKRPRVSISDLAGEALVIREQGSGSREVILRKLRQSGINPSVVAESESLGFILAYIERRMGISFIRAPEVCRELSEGTLEQISLVEGPITFESDIVILKGEPMSLPVRYFIKMARKFQEQHFAGE
jgi:DNA-binding transcriptional LysR family regulator